MLGDALVGMVLLAVLGVLAIRMTSEVAAARLERDVLEQMSELASDVLGEGRLGNCVKWHESGNTSDANHHCYLPLVTHISASVLPAPTCPDPNTGGGSAFTVQHMTVSVLDCPHSDRRGIDWPVRHLTVSDHTGRFEMTRVAVGKP